MRELDIDQPAQGRMGLPVHRKRGFEGSRSLLGEPNSPPPKVIFDNGNLDQAVPLQAAQIAGEGRLIEPRSQSQSPQRVIPRRRDLRHKPELSDAEPGWLHPLIQELCDAPRSEPGIPAGAGFDCGFRLSNERFLGGLHF